MILSIVQKNSIEGFITEWVCKRLLADECEVVAVSPGCILPDMAGKDVKMFGVSFPRELMNKLQRQAKTFHVYENDPTVRSKIGGIAYVTFKMNQSAARMAWNLIKRPLYLRVKGKKYGFDQAPWVVDYSDQPRLWKWKGLNHNLIRLAILDQFKFELESFDRLAIREPGGLMQVGKESAERIKKEIETENKQSKNGGQPNHDIADETGTDRGRKETPGSDPKHSAPDRKRCGRRKPTSNFVSRSGQGPDQSQSGAEQVPG